MRRGLVWLLAFGLAPSLAACAKKEDPQSSAQSQSKPDAAAGESPAAGEFERVEVTPGEPPKIEILEPGAEPRRELRFDPDAGRSVKMEMEMGMTMGMKMGVQQTPPVTTPPMVASGLLEVVEKRPNGEVATRLTLGAFEVLDDDGVDPRLVANLRTQMAGFSGMKSETTIDASGAVVAGFLEIPTGLPDNVRQTMRSMGESAGRLAVPLPSEPVGVGASWVATTVIENMGMKLVQRATYTLDALAGDTVSLSVQIEQEMAPGDFAPPGLPPGTQVDVEKMESTGKGKIEMNMREPMPRISTMDLETHMAMEIDAMGQKQSMAMDLEMGMELRIVEGAAPSP